MGLSESMRVSIIPVIFISVLTIKKPHIAENSARASSSTISLFFISSSIAEVNTLPNSLIICTYLGIITTCVSSSPAVVADISSLIFMVTFLTLKYIPTGVNTIHGNIIFISRSDDCIYFFIVFSRSYLLVEMRSNFSI